jgi:FAD/FMN-containing dehydrogenase
VHLDRGAFLARTPPRDASMTVTVGAGHLLGDLEASLAPAGLSLGPVSPGALALSVAAFLEGRHAGLRAVPLGRLEPLCAGLEAVLPGGQRLVTSDAPRSAAGPELAALVLGGEGRLGLVVGATLKCVPRPAAEATVSLVCSDPAAAVDAVRALLAAGASPARVRLGGRPLVAELLFRGPGAAVSRDVAQARLLGLPEVQPPPPLPAPPGEREAGWEQVEQALASGASLLLHRLALASAVVAGPVEGLALDEAGGWHPTGALLGPLGAAALGAPG